MTRLFRFILILFFIMIIWGNFCFAVDLSDIYSDNVSDDYKSGVLYDDFNDYIKSNISTYNSVIPTPYLDYLQQIALSRGVLGHYVAYVSRETSGNYNVTVYNIAVGDIIYNGGVFSGDVIIYKYYSNVNLGSVYRRVDDNNFRLTSSGGAIFTDLTSDYPDFVKNDMYVVYIYVMICCIVIFGTVLMFEKKTRKTKKKL